MTALPLPLHARAILLDYARRIVIVFEAMLLGKCGVVPRRFR
jgi:hypothetical protein